MYVISLLSFSTLGSLHLPILSQVSLMATSSTTYQSRLRVAVILVFLLIYLPFKPVGLVFPSPDTESMKEREKLVGSGPPRCVNKCLSCKPCMATVVIQPHRWKRFRASHDHEEGESYYLLSWKCKCGNKLFQP